jgi:hypothetical protein
MHSEILSETQKALLPHFLQFKRTFYLVGGTALALQIGHRQSIDFDFFTNKTTLNKKPIRQKLDKIPFPKRLLFEDTDQIHLSVNGIKTTFFAYPYDIPHLENCDNIITMPSILEIAAMKAFALGRRAKWKDYVDLYFVIKEFYSLQEIITKTCQLYDEALFSESLFRKQLAFHKDIDYTEEVEYMPGYSVQEQEVKEFLIEKALQYKL